MRGVGGAAAQVGAQFNVNNGLEITPSATVGDHDFRTDEGASPALVVLESGLVGVGTSSPASALHVSASLLLKGVGDIEGVGDLGVEG